ALRRLGRAFHHLTCCRPVAGFHVLSHEARLPSRTSVWFEAGASAGPCPSRPGAVSGFWSACLGLPLPSGGRGVYGHFRELESFCDFRRCARVGPLVPTLSQPSRPWGRSQVIGKLVEKTRRRELNSRRRALTGVAGK